MNSTILFGFKRHLLQKNKQTQTFTFKTAMQFSEVKSIQKKRPKINFGLFIILRNNYSTLMLFLADSRQSPSSSSILSNWLYLAIRSRSGSGTSFDLAGIQVLRLNQQWYCLQFPQICET